MCGADGVCDDVAGECLWKCDDVADCRRRSGDFSSRWTCGELISGACEIVTELCDECADPCNGIDDDGDGRVDEGDVSLDDGGLVLCGVIYPFDPDRPPDPETGGAECVEGRCLLPCEAD
jgi:hypothetical protein